ncbi:Hsp70 family protein [Streptomyces sp. ISL-10]|uniref:Hsp70 family protein n=1 Tax=Streptomyces sp. ISL-10 TaxID=2819172 RepID=UPI001BE89A36|nr:Hsp70 family protein [Streptomyces sp. ISL-10]MBT2364265.1 Hsp70 family protein [Streptomyces sp. ISL-10]
MQNERPLIGIDFGTATTLVSQRLPGSPPENVPIGRGTAWMPSVVAVSTDGDLLFGEGAEAVAGASALRSVKQCITFDTSPDALHVAGTGRSMRFTADFLIGQMLKHVALRAKASGAEMDGAVFRLACPAIWDGPRRRRLAGLARAAGIPVSVADIVDEPIAAGLAWSEGLFWDLGEDRPDGTTLVFDFGGGTLDIAVVEVTESLQDGAPELTVLSARGVAKAGDTLDLRIAKDLEQDLGTVGVDVDRMPDPSTVRALLVAAARRLKVLLSDTRYGEQAVPLGGGFTDLPLLTYSRHRLEKAFRPQLDEALEHVRAALCEARLRRRKTPDIESLARMGLRDLAPDVRHVLLAGGMSQVPLVRQAFEDAFPHAEVGFDRALATPEQSVVTGLVVRNYHRLNLPRPGFDLLLQWEDPDGSRHGELLYPAFEPLYSWDQVMRRERHLAHRWNGIPGVKRVTKARLRAESVDGEPMDFSVDGNVLPYLPIELYPRTSFSFELRISGEMVVRDATPRPLTFRVERWPVLRAGEQGAISLTQLRTGGNVPQPRSFTDVHSHPWE